MNCLLRVLVFTALLSPVYSSWWYLPCYLTYFTKPKCYGDLGCFSDEEPYDNCLCKLPQSPEEMGVKLKLFTASNQTEPTFVECSGLDADTQFDVNAPTKFVVHGFTDSADAEWANAIKDEFLAKEDMNVFLVDWNLGASQAYSQSCSNTRLVARMLAKFIRKLHDDDGLKYENVHLIGHSLGAHTCGMVGKNLTGLIGRITGLDPAGPYFDKKSPEVRLDPTDALFVDVIHTDGEHLTKLGFGMLMNMGHVDFLPEDGFEQKECPENIFQTLQSVIDGFSALQQTAACSHNRAPQFFLETINTCQYWASSCSSYEDYSDGKCACTSDKSNCNQMGYHADPSKHGQYYINLVGTKPFCAV